MSDWRALNDTVLLIVGLLFLCEFVGFLYANSLDGGFVFDDTSIVEVCMPEILKHDNQ